jgi:hypothetical protein
VHVLPRTACRNRFLVPGDACLRGTAFGYEPVRKLGWRKKLRTVIGAAICWRSRANTRSLGCCWAPPRNDKHRAEGSKPRAGGRHRRRARQRTHRRHAEDSRRGQHSGFGPSEGLAGKRHERRTRGTGATRVSRSLKEAETEEGSGSREGQPPTLENATVRGAKPRSRGVRSWQPACR